jgi:periplasmic protein CpxP/Spy
MNKKYLIFFVIITLVVTNAILLFFLMQRPKPPQPQKIVIERLGFDNNQIAAYQKLIEEHRKIVKALDTKILAAKNDLYLLLVNNDIPTTSVDDLATKIADAQKEIEIAHFNHFKEIKNICNSSQTEKFKQFAADLVNIFNPKKHLPR